MTNVWHLHKMEVGVSNLVTFFFTCVPSSIQFEYPKTSSQFASHCFDRKA